jgi:hypothetical protein
VMAKTYFSFRVDVWDDAGDSIVEHSAGIDDFETAVVTYWGAVRRWLKAKITLRQGARSCMRAGSSDKKCKPRRGHGELRRGSDARTRKD